MKRICHPISLLIVLALLSLILPLATTQIASAASVDDLQIAASADDGYCDDSGNYPTDTYANCATAWVKTGLRWQINIPAGATILSASIEVKAEGDYLGTNDGKIELFDEDSATDFSSSFWTRAVDAGAGSVTWDYVNWTANNWYTSPEIKTLVQAFIDQAGYSPGNYLGLRITGLAEVADWRAFLTWDNAAGDAAKLHIEYALPSNATNVGPTTLAIDGTFSDWGTSDNATPGTYFFQDASNNGADDGSPSANTVEDIDYTWTAMSTQQNGDIVASPSNLIQHFYYRIDTWGDWKALNPLNNGQSYYIQLNLGTTDSGFADHLLQIYVDSDAILPTPEVTLVLYQYQTPYPSMRAFTTGTIIAKVSNTGWGGTPTDTNASGAWGVLDTNHYAIEVKVPVDWYSSTYGGAVSANATGASTTVGAVFTATGGLGSVGTVKDTVNDSSGKTCVSLTNIVTGATSYVTGDIAQIAFTTSAQTVTAGQVSANMTIQTQDATGAVVNVAADTVILLSSDSPTGRFDTNPAGPFDGSTDNVTISLGTNSAMFYYKDTTSGTPTITAAEYPDQGWTDGTQQQTINPAPLDHFTFDPIINRAVGIAFSISITAKDEFENTVNTYNETNSLDDTSHTISPTTTTAFVDGVWTTDNITITAHQTNVQITTTGGGKLGGSNQLDVLTPPSINSSSTTDNITRHSAAVISSLGSLGEFSPVYVFFEYGLHTSYGSTTAEQQKTTAEAFSHTITGLTEGTWYHFRPVCRFGTDIYIYGRDQVFHTPPESGGGGGGGGGGTSLLINILGKTAGVDITNDGIIIEPCVVLSLEGELTLEVEGGTRLICGNNQVPILLEAAAAKEIPPPPEGMVIVSQVYDFVAFSQGNELQSVTFNPTATLTISYDPEAVPENTLSILIYYYDEELGWVKLEFPSGFVAEAGIAAALVSHFTPFAVMAEVAPPPPPPARFEVSNLAINPSQVEAGESTTISAQVANIGGTSGEYTLVLNIEGLLETSQVVELAPEQSQEISFTITPGSPGSYGVEIGGLRGNFVAVPMSPPEVIEPEAGEPEAVANRWLIPVIAAVAVIAALAFIIARRRLQPAAAVGEPAKPVPGPSGVSKVIAAVATMTASALTTVTKRLQPATVIEEPAKLVPGLLSRVRKVIAAVTTMSASALTTALTTATKRLQRTAVREAARPVPEEAVVEEPAELVPKEAVVEEPTELVSGAVVETLPELISEAAIVEEPLEPIPEAAVVEEPVKPVPGLSPVRKVMAAITALASTIVRKRPQPAAAVEEPAEFVSGVFHVNNLRIRPDRVKPGGSIAIVSAEATNTGPVTDTYSLVLRINGKVEAVKEITLQPGQSQKVGFTILEAKPGVYEIDLEGMKGTLTVEKRKQSR